MVFKKEFQLISKHNNRPFLIDGRWREGSSNLPVIIFIHGFKGFKDWGSFNLMADFFAKQNFAFFKLNLSHNGTTIDKKTEISDLDAFGNNNFSIELDDVEVLIDYLFEDSSLNNILNKENIYLIGHSRGGGLAILKAAEDKRIKKTASWGGIASVDRGYSPEVIKKWESDGVFYVQNSRTKQLLPLKYQLVEDCLNNETRLNIEKAFESLNNQVILVHGSDDPTVPLSEAQELHKRNQSNSIVVVEGGNHSFGGYHPYDEKGLTKHLEDAAKATIGFFEAT